MYVFALLLRRGFLVGRVLRVTSPWNEIKAPTAPNQVLIKSVNSPKDLSPCNENHLSPSRFVPTSFQISATAASHVILAGDIGRLADKGYAEFLYRHTAQLEAFFLFSRTMKFTVYLATKILTKPKTSRSKSEWMERLLYSSTVWVMESKIPMLPFWVALSGLMCTIQRSQSLDRGLAISNEYRIGRLKLIIWRIRLIRAGAKMK